MGKHAKQERQQRKISVTCGCIEEFVRYENFIFKTFVYFKLVQKFRNRDGGCTTNKLRQFTFVPVLIGHRRGGYLSNGRAIGVVVERLSQPSVCKRCIVAKL